jgi:hypothetical protein
MNDIIYLSGTVAFYALMLGYVAFCDRLGRTHVADSDHDAR